MQQKIDILIVGAGPAGASAAAVAANKGAKVLMIDKKKKVGVPVQCAEYIPEMLLNNVSVSSRCIAQRVQGLKTFFPSGECIKTRIPGVLLHRDRFDRELSQKAVAEGADLCLGTTCIGKKASQILISEKGKKSVITPRIVIGADGACSTVGKWMHSLVTGYIIGVQYTVPLLSKMEYTEVYFDTGYFGGYGWLFPKKNCANIGIGVKQGMTAKRDTYAWILLKKFLNVLTEQKKIEGNPLTKTKGLIPCSGPVGTVQDNIMLVGDAAGHTHPITGGGIPQAIICGQIAGEVAANALCANDMSVLMRYEHEWQRLYGDELQRAYSRRHFLEKNWDDLAAIIRKCWTVCNEYYGD